MIKHLLYSLPVVLIIIAACGGHSTQQKAPVSTSNKLNFGVLRYDSAALEYRLDSIHNRGLVLQFCTREAGDNNTAFQLISYAYDSLNDHNNSWMPDTLQIIGDSLPKNFSSKVTIGNNEVTREELLNTVRDEKGNRFSYDYVQFTPVVEGVFNHVVFMMRTYKNGKETEKGLQQMTSPMPPTRNWY
ncbi:MAG: hypothetical protein J7497_03475 [Chitinophagaceae bacterium]|nr:hypothetical protein [Chitinophagaceae bacterium]